MVTADISTPTVEAKPIEAQPQEARVESKGEVTPPAPQTQQFSEEQWYEREAEFERRLKDSLSGKDGTIAKIQGELKQLKQTKIESELADFIKSVEAKGGDVDLAKEIVSLRKATLSKAEELNAREEELKRVSEANETIARNLYIDKLVKEYGIKPDKLKECKTTVEMENVALKEALRMGKVIAQPADKVDSIKGAPKGRDLTGLSPEKRLAVLLAEKEKN